MKYNPIHTYELKPFGNDVDSIKSTESPDYIKELKKLLDDGIITQSEYDIEKKSILEENEQTSNVNVNKSHNNIP